MLTPSYAEITALVTVAEHHSFSAAARYLGISTSTLSGTLRKLEDKIGVRLVNRTTRSVALTQMGEDVLRQFHQMLETYAALDETVKASQGKVAGRICIVAQPPSVQVFLGSVVARFCARYADVSVSVVVTPREKVNMVAEEYDLGIGARRAIHEDMVAVRVSDPIRTIITASPAYFAKHPAPRAPEELKAHNCVRRCDVKGNPMPWSLLKNGRGWPVKVHGSIISNDSAMLLSVGIEGIAMIYTTYDEVAPFIADGKLVPVLEKWCFEYDGYYLYYPTRRQLPSHLRTFIDFVVHDMHSPQTRTLRAAIVYQT